MTESDTARKRTRWGCLSIPIIITLLFAWGRIQDIRYENQPLEVHLRDIFKESGFEVPADVADLTGEKGHVDFQGDFAARLTFTVKPQEVAAFMRLDPKYWDDPESFQQTEGESSCAGQILPSGSYQISQRGPGEYQCKYAVDPRARRIYFERSSW
jgi:hypothetical protein